MWLTLQNPRDHMFNIPFLPLYLDKADLFSADYAVERGRGTNTTQISYRRVCDSQSKIRASGLIWLV